MSRCHRRDVLKGGSLAMAVAALAWPGDAAAPAACEVRTPLGRLRGLRQGGADAYLDIPYGEQVSGVNRFKAATPVPGWTGVRDATRLGAASFQRAAKSWAIGEPPNAEECLVLNIWTSSAPGRDRPVMVYSHGGGLTLGSSGTIYTNGANLARMQDVVVVATNHRLGLLGFLYLDALGGEEYAGSGNIGLTDIRLALEWIQQNIAAFGGDPNNVMIFGESGGGLKTSCLYAMPAAANLFHKASIESGPGIRLLSRDDAAENSERVLQSLKLGKSNWRDMVNIPPQQILDAQEALAKATTGRDIYGGAKGIAAVGLGGIGPVLDGHVFIAHPFDPDAPTTSSGKPLIVGGNHDEETSFAAMRGDLEAFRLDEAGLAGRLGTMLGTDAPTAIEVYRRDRPQATPGQIYIAIRSALFSGIGARVIAERKSAQGKAPVYVYDLTYARGDVVPGTNYPFGALHGLDMPIKFCNTDPPPADSGLFPLAGLRPERVAMAHNMSALWAGFARTGKPQAEGVPDWPAYTSDTRDVMYLDVACSVMRDPDPNVRAFWAAHASRAA